MFILLDANQTVSPTFWERLISFISSDTFRNLIAAATLILAIIAGFRALKQWKESRRIKRAEYIKELTDRLRTDADIVKVIKLIDYSEFTYDEKFHKSKELEHQVDKTLSFFSYICYLREQDLLTSDEFSFYDYEIARIFQDTDMVNYLYNLYHFSQKQNRQPSFNCLVEYGLKHKLLDKNFTDINACKGEDPSYEAVLNI